MRQSSKSVINEMTYVDYNRLKMKYDQIITENRFMFIVLFGSILLNVVLVAELLA